LTGLPLPARIYHPVEGQTICKKWQKKMKEQESNMQEVNINTDENITGTSHLNEPVAEESELEKIKAELEDSKDKFVRKIAEFENFRRRSAKERMELIQTAGREIIIDMLEVLDDCDRAQKQIEGTDVAAVIKEGIMLVFNKLRNTLQARGVKAIETLNQEFNPDLHDAITEVAAATEDMKGKIVDEILKGYYLNDKIIRHAKVVVGK
jgi:molecular chaperone GrpE